jgi:hypothetical protein
MQHTETITLFLVAWAQRRTGRRGTFLRSTA